MKKILFLMFCSFLLLLGLVFFRPLLVVNPKVLALILHKSNVLTSWSWSSAKFSHERKSLLHRNFQGTFRDFCFDFKRPSLAAHGCLEIISWNVDISWKEGIKIETIDPLKLYSSNLEITKSESRTLEPETSSEPPDIKKYWNLFWASNMPDMDFRFDKITLHLKKELEFDFSLFRKRSALTAEALGFNLQGNPSGFVLKAPEKLKIPKDFGTSRPLYLRNFNLTGKMMDHGLSLFLQGAVEVIHVKVESFLDLPLKGHFDSLAFRKNLFLKTRGELLLTGLSESLRKYGPKPYNSLPAPLSEMDGNIISSITIKEKDFQNVVISPVTNINLAGQGQVFDMNLEAAVPLNVVTFKRGLIGLDIHFNKLALKLPRLSKKEMPPQMKPEGRFVKHQDLLREKKKPLPLRIHLATETKKSFQLSSNLLKEPVRLDFDIQLSEKGIRDGYVKLLPLKTTVFKRPIRVNDLLITFNAPLSPVIESQVVFPLPEYKITMNIEGPVNKPRYAFQSDPPLPESDIYAVLLFGRPMDDLPTDDKSEASRTNQVLAQGLFSLSTLYFLAGSPVEYIGYDPSSRQATAQFGLGRKSSLRVGGGGEGINSTAVRRSLGKGWYIDTSVQNTSSGTSTDRVRDYGVLLERIIAY